MGAAPNPAGGDRSRDLGESRSGAGEATRKNIGKCALCRHLAAAYGELAPRPTDKPTTSRLTLACRRSSGSSRRSSSRRAICSCKCRTRRPIYRRRRSPGATRDKLMAEHRCGCNRARPASSLCISQIDCAGRRQTRKWRLTSGRGELRARRFQAYVTNRRSRGQRFVRHSRRQQLAYIASLYAGVDEAERIVREVETIRAGARRRRLARSKPTPSPQLPMLSHDLGFTSTVLRQGPPPIAVN